MRHCVLLILLCVGTSASASNNVKPDCHRLALVLDARLSPDAVAREWAAGHDHSEAPAVLELRDCSGRRLDRLKLEAPLAQLDAKPLRGAPEPTYLISSDLTAEAGSYNGPLTQAIQIAHGQLVPVLARDAAGKAVPMRVALTGKAAWKRVTVGAQDHILSVSCRPKANGQGFVTTYQRYAPGRNGWRVKTRSEDGFWESEGDFPEVRRFP